jgi:hypothetical protein
MTPDTIDIVRLGADFSPLPGAEEVGSKAANLARMMAIGLPVPPAFVLPVQLCADIAANYGQANRFLPDLLTKGIGFLEQNTGKRFGDRRRPLLVSVRSGAPQSMPGMLDTVLNVGCTAAATQGLIRMTGIAAAVYSKLTRKPFSAWMHRLSRCVWIVSSPRKGRPAIVNSIVKPWND